MKDLNLVIQKWEESESGWGTRPDGISIHTSMAECKRYRDFYWKKELERTKGVTPHEYTREDGNPFDVVVVNENIKQELIDSGILEKNSLRLYHRHPLEMKILESLRKRKI